MRSKLEENQKVLVENQKKFRYWEGTLSKLSLQNLKYDVFSVFMPGIVDV